MIIGFDGSRAFVENKTGTENYSYQLLKALSKIDKKNKYIVFIRPEANVGKDWPANFQFSTINFQFLWTQLGLSIKTFQDKLDILFVPAHTLPIIRKPGLKTVITVHDLGSEFLPSMHQVKQRLYLSYMQKYQLKTVTRLIAVSNATKDDLVKRLNIKKEKVSVVYEGFNENISKIDTKVNSLKQFDLEKGKYFLFVGTVQPRKNLERIIRAFEKYLITEVNTKLVIVGSKGWLSDEIYRLPKQLGIEDMVKFLGYVPDPDLSLLYCGAKAFIYPSLFEGFGLPILEAQSCGCPVITSNISSMPEVAGKGAILVDPYSIDDIVGGMEEIQDSRLKIQDLIKEGYKNLKRFSWDSCAQDTLKVLENI